MVLAITWYKLLYHEFSFVHRSSDPYHWLVVGLFCFSCRLPHPCSDSNCCDCDHFTPYPRQGSHL